MTHIADSDFTLMATANKQTSRLIMVTEDHATDPWSLLDGAESTVQSRLAVSQDIWGLGCFGPGQASTIQEGANCLAISKEKIVGAIGSSLGSFAAIAEERDTYIELFESRPEIFDCVTKDANLTGKYVKVANWNPAKPALRANRYHRLFAIHAFSATPNPLALVKTVMDALKPEGLLFTDELWAKTPVAARILAQGLQPAGTPAPFPMRADVMKELAAAGMEMRVDKDVSEPLMATIRQGMTHAKKVVALLKQAPQPFRSQRLEFFTTELERAALLHTALEKGLLIATRTIHRSPHITH